MLPRQFVRETVPAPKRILVTEAAETLGVGRPALSNFLHMTHLRPRASALVPPFLVIKAKRLRIGASE
jgi:hypothetical protein